MKVQLYNDGPHGKRGEVVELDGAIGEALHARGECAVIQHDPPKKGTPKGELKELDKKTKAKLEDANGNGQ